MAEKNKISFKGILKSIDFYKGKDGKVNNKIVVMTMENEETKSTVDIKFFTNDWDKVKTWNSVVNKVETFDMSKLNDDIKNRAFKNYIKGKEQKTYYTKKSFIDDLKLCVGKKVLALGTTTYSVNDKGYLQVNYDITNVELVDKKERSALVEETHCLISYETIQHLKINTPFELYLPIGKNNPSYFKITTLIPADRYIEGMAKTEDVGNEILDSIREIDLKNLSGKWFTVPVFFEVENGKSERQPTEDDLSVGIKTMLKLKSKNNDEIYKKGIQAELSKLGMIPIENSSNIVTNIFGNGLASIKRVDTPNFYESTQLTAGSTTSTVKEILERAKQQNSVSESKVEETKETPNVVDKPNETTPMETPQETKEIETENENENDIDDDFPF